MSAAPFSRTSTTSADSNIDVTPPNPNQLLTIDEACSRLRVGRTWLYERIAAGEIRAVKVGRGKKVSERELERYLDRMAQRR